MTEEEPKAPVIILPPLPETKRGYSVQINGSKNNQIAYCNGRFVFIRSLVDNKVTIFTKHLYKVNAATISPNGNWVATGDEMGQVYVWHINRPDITKNELKACRKVNCICWSFDSKRVCAAGDGNPNRAKVFPYDSGNSCGKVEGHTAQIISCDWNGKRPFRLATSGEDLCVAVYDNVPVKQNLDFEGEDHIKYCNSVKYSPDSTMLATAGADSKIFVYDGKKPSEPVKKMGGKKKGHKGSAIYSMVWSPDSKMLATGSSDKTVKVWDVETKNVVKTFVAGEKSHEFFQVGIVWLEKFFLSVSLNGSMTLWDFESEKPTKRICGHRAKISGMTLSEGTLISTDSASKLTKWDLKTGDSEWFEGDGHKEKNVSGIATLKSGLIATVGLDDSLRLTDPKGKAFGNEPIPVGGCPTGLAAAHTKDLVAAFIAQGKITMVEDKKAAFTLSVDYKPLCGSFTMDDKMLVVGDDAGTMHCYTVDGSKLEESDFKLGGVHGGPIYSVACSPDGKLIATTGASKKIHITSTAKGGETLNSFGWEYHNARINSIAFSPDSSKLVSASMDETIIVWKDLDKFDAKSRERFTCHIAGVNEAMWLDNDTIITTGGDNCIKTWKI